MEIKIEKNVPLRAVKENRTQEYINALDKMDLGDSFLVQDSKTAALIRAKVYRKDYYMAVRKEGDKLRIWKISK